MTAHPDILPDAGGSLLRRIRYTPLSDLVRGRVTARLDTEQLIARSGIPVELAAIVRQVARRTRLWRAEKAEVAEELIAHFRDSIDRGARPDEVARNFGDSNLAARLIRRARRRGRPLPIRAVLWTIRGVGCLMLACVAAYVFFAIRMHTGTIVIRRNYVAEFNAPILAMKEEDKAWPLYKQAFLSTSAAPELSGITSIHATTKDWPKWAAYAAANQEAIRLYRLAAGKPHLGKVVYDADDPEIIAHRKQRGESLEYYSTRTASESPSLVRVLLPELAILREGARLLASDAIHAMLSHDNARLTSDLSAMLAMADHVAEQPLLISGLTAISLMAKCEAVIDDGLACHPADFSDASLKGIAHRLGGCINQGRLHASFEAEWAIVEDLIQRTFTDDGCGDGWLARPDLLDEWTRGFLPGPEIPTNAPILPVRSALSAGRRRVMDRHREIAALAQEEAATPLWKRRESKADEAQQRMVSGQFERLRYAPLPEITASFSRASYLYEVATLKRDATLTAIALELYHRRRGAYPAALAELVPQFLPSVPLDRYDGRPLKYRLESGKPLLYSVGVDRDDDGGVLPKNASKRWANRDAREWMPPDAARSADPGMRARVPDGDWILYPPVEDSAK